MSATSKIILFYRDNFQNIWYISKATAVDFNETPGGKSADLVHQTSGNSTNLLKIVKEIE